MDHNKQIDPKAAAQLISAETAIGYLLRGGVIVAGTLIALGWALKLRWERGISSQSIDVFSELARGQELPKEVAFSVHWDQIWEGLRQGRSNDWLILGLVTLIALPILRVFLAVFVFLLQKDYLFVLFSLVVLFNLLIGLMSHSIL